MMRRKSIGLTLVALVATSACDSAKTEANKGMTTPSSSHAAPSTSQPASAPTDSEAAVKAKQLVDQLASGKLDDAVASFDAAMAKAFPKETAADTWKTIVAQVGEFKSASVSKTERMDKAVRAMVAAEFEHATLEFVVVVGEEGKISGFFVTPPKQPDIPWDAPDYAKKESFTEEDVTVGEGALALPGTLTLPKGDAAKKLSAVVLVHGSGPNDRDESIGAQRPFKDLAWGLASRGIVVLRYEKVTRAHGAKFIAAVGDNITLNNETIDDALRGVALLRKHPRVDPKKVFFMGHSQGAMAAPRAGSIDHELAGLVIMAGPTRRFEDVAVAQIEYISTIPGPNGEGAKKMLQELREAAKLVKSSSLDAKTPKDKLPFGIPAPFWVDIRDYKPQEVAAGLKMPVLVLQGEADYQVTMADFEGWQKGLKAKQNAKLKSYPSLAHTFIDCHCKLAKPDYAKPGNVAAAVIDDVAKWITGT